MLVSIYKKSPLMQMGLLVTTLFILFTGCSENKGKDINRGTDDDEKEVVQVPFNPLAYFAEYNVKDLEGTFETAHSIHKEVEQWPTRSPLEKTHLLKWSQSMGVVTGGAYEAYAKGKDIAGATWYLPTWYEWQAIIPTSIIDFMEDESDRKLEPVRVAVAYKKQTGEPNLEEEEGKHTHTNYTMSGTFWSGNPCYASLEYIEDGTGTVHHVIAKYTWESNSTFAGLKIEMAAIKQKFESKEAVMNDPVWSTVDGVVSRLFPAAGYHIDGALWDAGGNGDYWSATESKSGEGLVYHVDFYESNVYSQDANNRNQAFSVRLIKRAW